MMYQFEQQLVAEGYRLIAGVDEVGRGPMAGPLVAAAVILPVGHQIEGINDSKKLSHNQRQHLYTLIKEQAIAIDVAFIEVDMVDHLNVYQATKKAMLQCVNHIKPDVVLIDAMLLDTTIPQISLIKGDQLSASIAAASIIAKVERDRYMEKMDQMYPQYGFAQHKGYVTKKHLDAIKKHGITPIHRLSFAPVREVIENQK